MFNRIYSISSKGCFSVVMLVFVGVLHGLKCYFRPIYDPSGDPLGNDPIGSEHIWV